MIVLPQALEVLYSRHCPVSQLFCQENYSGLYSRILGFFLWQTCSPDFTLNGGKSENCSVFIVAITRNFGFSFRCYAVCENIRSMRKTYSNKNFFFFELRRITTRNIKQFFFQNVVFRTQLSFVVAPNRYAARVSKTIFYEQKTAPRS